MELTINGKKYQFYFGVGFVRQLDQRYGMQNNAGFSLGMGLTKALPALELYDTATLAEVLECAAEPSISLHDIDSYLDAPDTDIEKVFKDVSKDLSKANAVKLAAKNLKNAK